MSKDRGGTDRQWDEFDVYLFDIDGTLLHCRDAVHYFAFCEVLSELAQRPLTIEGVTTHGNTDMGIMRDALALASVPDDLWRPQIHRIQEQMCCSVRAREHELCVVVMPRVKDVLDYLRARGAVLGVATGNLCGIGETKMRKAGLLHYFSFSGWSNDFEYRRDVFASAAAAGRAIAGDNAGICVVGDTPADVQAARINGLSVIAVATGIYSHEQLAAASPDFCVHSLDELIGSAQGLPA